MKTGSLILLPLILALGACAPQPTLEQLEYQALQTGDWSAVEKRERAMARRAERTGPACPPGQIRYCENRVGDRECRCATQRSLGVLFGRRF